MGKSLSLIFGDSFLWDFFQYWKYSYVLLILRHVLLVFCKLFHFFLVFIALYCVLFFNMWITINFFKTLIDIVTRLHSLPRTLFNGKEKNVCHCKLYGWIRMHRYKFWIFLIQSNLKIFNSIKVSIFCKNSLVLLPLGQKLNLIFKSWNLF